MDLNNDSLLEKSYLLNFMINLHIAFPPPPKHFYSSIPNVPFQGYKSHFDLYGRKYGKSKIAN